MGAHVVTFDDTISGVSLKPSNEVTSSLTKGCEPFKAGVSTIKNDNVASFKRDHRSDSLFVNPTGGHGDKIRQITGMVELHMEFDGPFGLTELGPVKDGKTKIDGGGIKAEDGILEPEFMLRCNRLAFGQHGEKDFFKKLMTPVFIGVGEG